MLSDKHNSIMAIATGLILSLFNISCPEIAFSPTAAAPMLASPTIWSINGVHA